MVGRASGRDQHVFCPDSFAIGQAKGVGIFEYGAGLDDARAGLFDIRGVDASSRAISLSLLATSVGQSKVTGGIDHPKPAASSISWWMCDPITKSFFGTQPRITQVPPIRYSSATMTRAP